MKYRKRIYYTEADKALMWDRWQKGNSLHEIARLFDRPHSSVRGILERTGGIRPPTRRRSSRSLALSEREEISRGLAAGRSLRAIALRLGRAPSTISRELNRNGGLGSYRAHTAEQAAWDRACRPKRCKLALNRPLVERHSRYCMLVRTDSKDTKIVINALIKQAHKLPRELYKSLTWDRGKEMADHKRFSLATDIKVYFCDPQSPWQRGSNEQINGLLRQYFPKGMDLSGVHQNKLNAVARQLNERPRETLNFETPAERFNQCVASIG